MAKIVAADCASCGASLQVDPGAREASCTYCGQTNLLVRDKKAARAAPGPAIVLPRALDVRRIVVIVAAVGFFGAGLQCAVRGLMAQVDSDDGVFASQEEVNKFCAKTGAYEDHPSVQEGEVTHRMDAESEKKKRDQVQHKADVKAIYRESRRQKRLGIL